MTFNKFKAGFYVIVDDRKSQITESSAIVCDHMETHFCDRNGKNFKDKNKKAKSWEKIGEKFNLSCLFVNTFRI